MKRRTNKVKHFHYPSYVRPRYATRNDTEEEQWKREECLSEQFEFKHKAFNSHKKVGMVIEKASKTDEVGFYHALTSDQPCLVTDSSKSVLRPEPTPAIGESQRSQVLSKLDWLRSHRKQDGIRRSVSDATASSFTIVKKGSVSNTTGSTRLHPNVSGPSSTSPSPATPKIPSSTILQMSTEQTNARFRTTTASRVPQPELSLAQPRREITLKHYNQRYGIADSKYARSDTSQLAQREQDGQHNAERGPTVKASESPIAKLGSVWDYCGLPVSSRLSGRNDCLPFAKGGQKSKRPFLDVFRDSTTSVSEYNRETEQLAGLGRTPSRTSSRRLKVGTLEGTGRNGTTHVLPYAGVSHPELSKINNKNTHTISNDPIPPHLQLGEHSLNEADSLCGLPIQGRNIGELRKFKPRTRTEAAVQKQPPMTMTTDLDAITKTGVRDTIQFPLPDIDVTPPCSQRSIEARTQLNSQATVLTSNESTRSEVKYSQSLEQVQHLLKPPADSDPSKETSSDSCITTSSGASSEVFVFKSPASESKKEKALLLKRASIHSSHQSSSNISIQETPKSTEQDFQTSTSPSNTEATVSSTSLTCLGAVPPAVGPVKTVSQPIRTNSVGSLSDESPWTSFSGIWWWENNEATATYTEDMNDAEVILPPTNFENGRGISSAPEPIREPMMPPAKQSKESIIVGVPKPVVPPPSVNEDGDAAQPNPRAPLFSTSFHANDAVPRFQWSSSAVREGKQPVYMSTPTEASQDAISLTAERYSVTSKPVLGAESTISASFDFKQPEQSKRASVSALSPEQYAFRGAMLKAMEHHSIASTHSSSLTASTTAIASKEAVRSSMRHHPLSPPQLPSPLSPSLGRPGAMPHVSNRRVCASPSSDRNSVCSSPAPSQYSRQTGMKSISSEMPQNVYAARPNQRRPNPKLRAKASIQDNRNAQRTTPQFPLAPPASSIPLPKRPPRMAQHASSTGVHPALRGKPVTALDNFPKQYPPTPRSTPVLKLPATSVQHPPSLPLLTRTLPSPSPEYSSSSGIPQQACFPVAQSGSLLAPPRREVGTKRKRGAINRASDESKEVRTGFSRFMPSGS